MPDLQSQSWERSYQHGIQRPSLNKHRSLWLSKIAQPRAACHRRQPRCQPSNDRSERPEVASPSSVYCLRSAFFSELRRALLLSPRTNFLLEPKKPACAARLEKLSGQHREGSQCLLTEPLFVVAALFDKLLGHFIQKSICLITKSRPPSPAITSWRRQAFDVVCFIVAIQGPEDARPRATQLNSRRCDVSFASLLTTFEKRFKRLFPSRHLRLADKINTFGRGCGCSATKASIVASTILPSGLRMSTLSKVLGQ